jgi:Mg2+/citrate symporter
MPLYVMDVLLSTVLRPNLPVQIAGIILMLFAAAYMGYAIRADCGGANRSR